MGEKILTHPIFNPEDFDASRIKEDADAIRLAARVHQYITESYPDKTEQYEVRHLLNFCQQIQQSRHLNSAESFNMLLKRVESILNE